MTNKLKKYRILILIYFLGIIASLGAAHYIKINNIFSDSVGKLAEIRFEYNEEVFQNIKRFNSGLSIYTNLRQSTLINFVTKPELPIDALEFRSILNSNNSLLDYYTSLYLLENFPDTALSKAYRNYYGKLEVNFDQFEPRLYWIIRADSKKDFESYKKILIKSSFQTLINLVGTYKKNLTIHLNALDKAIYELENIINNNEFDFIKNTNTLEQLKLERYSLISIITLTDEFTINLSNKNIIKKANVKFYKTPLLTNSVYFVIPIIFIIVISFFVLLHRIFYDFRKK